MHDDERELLRRLLPNGPFNRDRLERNEPYDTAWSPRAGAEPNPRSVAIDIGIHPKRLEALCLKWTRRGYYDYGVSSTLGWLTPEGHAHFTALLGASQTPEPSALPAAQRGRP